MSVYHHNGFTSGQLSPLLLGRYDLEAYQKGCLNLQNATVMQEGGATRRMGSYFLGECKYHTRHTRLIPFYYNRHDFCMIEMGHKYLRFWRPFGIIKKDNKTVELETPYESTDIYDVDYHQIGNKIFFTHKKYPVHLLKREKPDYTEWSFSIYDFKYPITKDINPTKVALKPKEQKSKTTIEAVNTNDFFKDYHKGTGWLINQYRSNAIVTQDDMSGGTTPSLVIEGMYSFVTHGSWSGKVKIEKSEDNGNSWKDVRTFTSEEDYNVDFTGDENYEGIIYRVNCPNGKPKNLEFELEVEDKYEKIPFRITKVVNATKAEVETLDDKIFVSTDSSKLWYAPELTEKEGYPELVESYEQRLVFVRDDRLWMSCTDDWNSFKKGDLATDAISILVPTTSKIEWILTAQEFIIGATDKQFSLGTRSRTEPLSPSNVPKLRPQSHNGSSEIHGQLFGNTIVYVQSHYQKVNSFEYNWQEQQYNSPELTLLASNITGEGVLDMALSYDPQPIMWFTRGDGDVIGLTYNRTQEVSAWHHHDFGGKTQCCAVVPQGFVNEDALWRIERRFINGQYKMYIERETQKGWGEPSKAVYLDSALSNGGYDYIDFSKVHFKNDYTIKVETDTDLTKHLSEGDTIKLYQPNNSLDETVIGDIKIIDNYHLEGKTASRKIEKQTGKLSKVAKTFSGLEHLEGCTVQGWADGYVPSEMLVNNGQVTLDIYARQVFIGLPYKTIIEPMPLAVNTSSGSTIPNPLKLNTLFIRFYKSTGAKLFIEDKEYEINWRTTDMPLNKWSLIENKLEEIAIASGYKRILSYRIIQEKPAPVTVLSTSNLFIMTE